MPRRMRTDKRVPMELEELFVFDSWNDAALAERFGTLEAAHDRFDHLTATGQLRTELTWEESRAKGNAGLRVVDPQAEEDPFD